jgi:diguanylate cyclase (GGDEF)-like protein
MSARSTRRFICRAVLPLLALSGLLSFNRPAWAAERGLPLVTTFPAEVHRAGPQVFDIAQDSRGILYFGTLHGLATYDGAAWRLQKLPDEQVALSLATDSRGGVAIGMVDDFGYLESLPAGETFRSLLPGIPEAKRNFGNVNAICSTAAGFLYLAERSLLLWDGKRVSIAAEYTQNDAPRGCLAQGSEAFLRGPKGLHRLDLTTLAITPAGVDQRLMLLMPRTDGSLMAVTREGKVLLVDNGTATPFAPLLTQWLTGKLVMGGCRLRDGRLVIATRQDGVVVVSQQGEIDATIGTEAGMPDAVMNDVLVDREGSLWVAMDGPIARVDLTSPVTAFDSRIGLRGGAGDVARHRGRLYATTTHGLFELDERGYAHRVGTLEDAWRLLPVDGELLVGSGKGIHVVDSSGRLVHAVKAEWIVADMFRSRVDPSRVWLAGSAGLASIRRVDGRWQDEGLVPAVDHDLSSVVEHDGTLWIGSVFDGVIRVDRPRTAQQRVARYGSGEMNPYLIAGRPVFVQATGGILQIDATGKLVPDAHLGHIQAPHGFFVAAEDRRGAVWINSTPPRVFEPRADGGYSLEGKPLVSVTAADIQNIRIAEQGAVWFASDKGLFRYDPDAGSAPVGSQPAPFIRRIVVGENELPFTRSGPPSAPLELTHKFGRMRIEYAPLSYRPGTSYQYRLDPIDSDWSSWTEQSFIDYTTLEPNDYTFRVRARGPAMVPGNETSWSFSVLSPWYRTRWAWAMWIVLALAVIGAVIRIRTRRLHRQAEKLRKKVAEQTAELHETVRLLESANAQLEALSLEDDLTGIANRRFFERALADEWNRARRREQPLALILVDLDHFKDLNDRLGHPAGDDALRRIGAFLQETVRRSGEVVARYGGEEFGVLLPGASSGVGLRVAETLRAGIERLAIPNGENGSVMTASCGVASVLPSAGITPDDLVACADRALYAAKHSGRNCVRVAEDIRGESWLRDVSA